MNVSGIVCPLNTAKFIEQCISSILSQVDELIVVDASSDDGTVELIKKKFKSKKIKIYIIPRDKPLAYARNFGAKKAKHPLILFSDADLVLDKNWVQVAKDTLLKENLASIGGKTKVIGSSILMKFLRVMRHREVYACKYPTRLFLMDKKAFDSVNGFDERNKMGEDENLYKRLLIKGYRAKNIYTIAETHLGEPDSLSRLLKRQAKYGRFSYLERGKKPYSLGNILLAIVMISPLGILYSIRIYTYMFRKKLKESRDIVFLVLMPFYLYLFFAVYFWNNLVGFVTKNRDVKWHKLKW